jgi:metal-responsive CopG/Arc/MetJ family transcriptional regulator
MKRRGAIKTDQSTLVALWVPRPLLAAIDVEVEAQDSDRSKWIRRAIRARLAKLEKKAA